VCVCVCYSLVVQSVSVIFGKYLCRKRRFYSVWVSCDVLECGQHVVYRRSRRRSAANLTGTMYLMRHSGLLSTLHRNADGRWLPQKR